jgi:acylphosphatase
VSEPESADAAIRHPAAPATRRRVDATVRGHVQGVGFRWYVQRTAARLELTGWVANTPDGAVRVVAEGATEDLGALLESLRRGPPSAHVSAVDVRWAEATDVEPVFAIRSGGHSGD